MISPTMDTKLVFICCLVVFCVPCGSYNTPWAPGYSDFEFGRKYNGPPPQEVMVDYINRLGLQLLDVRFYLFSYFSSLMFTVLTRKYACYVYGIHIVCFLTVPVYVFVPIYLMIILKFKGHYNYFFISFVNVVLFETDTYLTIKIKEQEHESILSCSNRKAVNKNPILLRPLETYKSFRNDMARK